MSTYWLIRIVLVGVLFFRLALNGYFLKNREEYSELLERSDINLISTVSILIVLIGIVVIPSEPSVLSKPQILMDSLVENWYLLTGFMLLFIGGIIYVKSIQIRKGAYGSADAGELITEGIYSFCRHPIYLGLSLIFLGIPLILSNFDALLVYPSIFLFFLIEGKIEERFDVGTRFPKELEKYKEKTRVFGPYWFWASIIIILILPLGIVKVV